MVFHKKGEKTKNPKKEPFSHIFTKKIELRSWDISQ